MLKSKSIIFTLFFSLVSAMTSFATEVASKVVQIKNAYVRALPKNIRTTASFMTLINTGKENHQLVAVTSNAATQLQLHHTINDKGIMKMKRVNLIDLPTGKTLHLQPGSYHIMLIELTQPLTADEKIPLTLIFEDGSHISQDIIVKKETADTSSHQH